MRAVLITRRLTYVDDGLPRVTPAVGTLPELLDRLAAAYTEGSGVALLAPDIAESLGFPVDELPAGPEAKSHPAAEVARAAGWKVRSVHRWTRFTRGRSQVVVGLLDLIDAEYCPLIADFPADTTASFAAWHEATGAPWYGDPGEAGNAVLQASQPAKYEAKGRDTATWWTLRGPADDPVEWPLRVEWWRREEDKPYEHLYDCTRAYLAAMRTVEVARWQLTPTGRIEFDPKRAGWWLVELSPWTLSHLMPDPAGEGDGTTRWVTTPTMNLLTELTEQKVFGTEQRVYDGVRVLDSWTAAADRAVMTTYADRLNKAYLSAVAMPDSGDARRLKVAAREAFTWSYGAWRSKKSDVQRPDWAAAVVAEARSNLWRRMWTAGGGGKKPDRAKPGKERWPLRIATDAVWYASDDPDPYADPPAGFKVVPPDEDGRPISDGALGTFKVKGTRERAVKV